ncbi:restriction endonuclease subunit S [Desulfobacter postgatei]|uniref:Restriction endonuclease S subunit n=1 Tax=Desulfobacter postgatei 2ac9 TaxID=879212 RepID=I5AZV0_9BACT|nr:restriction endonuclease subunit S [Desulfobacter postgatei]EIM62763.1 restriction endonuclease S subunit [Desulfobacter postgatei 2ac9]
MKWVTLPFSKAISDVTGGNTKIQKKALSLRGKVPVVDQGHDLIAGYTNDEAYFKGKIPIVLFGDHTRIFKYIDFPFALGADGVKALQTKDFLYPKFFFYFCQTVNIPSNGYSRHFKFLKPVHIPLPPPSEQRKIVEILDQADRLRKLRAEADKKAERILPALFIKMFGDPASNPMGWKTGTLGDVTLDLRYGTSIRCETYVQGFPVLRIPNVLSGQITISDLKYAKISDKQAKPLLLEKGDILFVRTNGNRNYVGRCAVFDLSDPYLYASYLIRARINKTKAYSKFLATILNTPIGRKSMEQYIRTTAGQSNINQEGLRQIPIILPPLPLQAHFLNKIEQIESSRMPRENCTNTFERLFNNLLHRAFTGDLTASWRQAHMKELLQEMEIQARALAG